MHHTTQAIILKKVIYGEADFIVTFFGRDEGRTSGIAKHARASQRRFGGALELGSIVDIRYTVRQSSDIVRIEDAHVDIPTIGIMQSLERIGAVSKALELALAFLPASQPSPEKFDLLKGHIKNLAKQDPTPSSIISYELKWLSYVGYQPSLEHCVVCESQIEQTNLWSFSVDHGGIICQNCSSPKIRKINLKDRTLNGMRSLAQGTYIKLEQEDSHVIQGLLMHFVQHILGRPLHVRTL